METKSYSSFLIHLINNHYPLSFELEEKIKEYMQDSFERGYADCLKDVREGIIK